MEMLTVNKVSLVTAMLPTLMPPPTLTVVPAVTQCVPRPVSCSVALVPCGAAEIVCPALFIMVTDCNEEPLLVIVNDPLTNSLAVAMVRVRLPKMAIGSMVIGKPACAESVMVTGPTVTPSPNATAVTPCVKFVFWPTTDTVVVPPAGYESGEIETMEGVASTVTGVEPQTEPAHALMFAAPVARP